jgi:uncharacterized protein YdaU (DUF1376 family)
MSNPDWMPLNINDYLSDTNHLTLIEHGAYVLLICRYWKDGGLPADERMIARYSRMTPEQWAESRDVLAAFFDEGWRHNRIDRELQKAREIMEKRAAAADASHARRKRDANAVQMQSTCSDTRVPTLTTNPSSLRSDEEKLARKQRAARLPENWSLPAEWRQDAVDAGLPADRIDAEAARMRNWSRSSPNGAKLDWRSAWRNWCTRIAAEIPPARGSPPKRETAAEAGARRVELLRQRDAEYQFGQDGEGGTHSAIARLLPGYSQRAG